MHAIAIHPPDWRNLWLASLAASLEGSRPMSRDVKIGFIVALVFLGSIAGAVWFKLHASPNWSLVELVPMMDLGAMSPAADPAAAAAPMTPFLKSSPPKLPVVLPRKDKQKEKSKTEAAAASQNENAKPVSKQESKSTSNVEIIPEPKPIDKSEPKIKPRPPRDLYKVVDSGVPLKPAAKTNDLAKPKSLENSAPVILVDQDDLALPPARKSAGAPLIMKSKGSASANSPSATVRSTPPLVSAKEMPEALEAPKSKKSFSAVEKLELPKSAEESPIVPAPPSFSTRKSSPPSLDQAPTLTERKSESNSANTKFAPPPPMSFAEQDKPAQDKRSEPAVPASPFGKRQDNPGPIVKREESREANTDSIVPKPPMVKREDFPQTKPGPVNEKNVAAPIVQRDDSFDANSVAKSLRDKRARATAPVAQQDQSKSSASDLPPVRRVDFSDLENTPKSTPATKEKEYTGPLPNRSERRKRIEAKQNLDSAGGSETATKRPAYADRRGNATEGTATETAPPLPRSRRDSSAGDGEQKPERKYTRTRERDRNPAATAKQDAQQEPEVELTNVAPLPAERVQEMREREQLMKTRSAIPSSMEPIADSKKFREPRREEKKIEPTPEPVASRNEPENQQEVIAKSRPVSLRELNGAIETLNLTKVNPPETRKTAEETDPPPLREDFVPIKERREEGHYAAVDQRQREREAFSSDSESGYAQSREHTSRRANIDQAQGYERTVRPRVKVNSFNADRYIVLEGDTIESIAMAWYRNKDYAASLAKFNKLNVLADDPLRPGSRIILPPQDRLVIERVSARPNPNRDPRPRTEPEAASPPESTKGNVVLPRSERNSKPIAVPESPSTQEIARNDSPRRSARADDDRFAEDKLPPARPMSLANTEQKQNVGAAPKQAKPPRDSFEDDGALPRKSSVKAPTKSDAPPPPALANKEAAGNPQNATDGSTYTVSQDETLWKIAKRKLGSGQRMKEIFELNRDKLESTIGVIPAGTVLKMPKI